MTVMERSTMRLRAALVTAVLMLICLPARADTYRVDLIVFLDKYASAEAGAAPQAPAADAAIALQNGAALAAAGIRVLPDAEFGLSEQWNRLRNAARFQPLIRIAWTQKDPPSERGPALQLRYGQALTVTDPQTYTSYLTAPVDGSVALRLSRYLHIDVDLRYMQAVDGGYRQYSLRERRRMRRNELHHLDSPKLGVLARVNRVE